MKFIQSTLVLASSLFLFSCGASKKLQIAESRYARLDSSYRVLQNQLNGCESLSAKRLARLEALEEQMKNQKVQNDVMVNQLKDLSVISSSQAESIKKSLENISGKDAYIKDLQGAMSRKDSITMNLVMNLKGALGNISDEDVDIKIDKGVVYIDISDKMLFRSGSYEVTPKAKEVLGKVAKVLNNQPDIEFLVEGHTDDVPFRQEPLVDNWDLSVMRATSIVRLLQNQYKVPPARMAASGRSEFKPIASNDTEKGRSLNRRTRIVILPQLDQFFKLLENPTKGK